MELKPTKRIFEYHKDKSKDPIILPEVSTTMTAEDHIKFYANTYPELAIANAEAPRYNQDGDMVIKIVTTPGERG